MAEPNQNDPIEIEPLSDEALQEVAGGTEVPIDAEGSTGPRCCSDSQCSN